LDFSRAVLAVAVAILFQLALVQENCDHPNVVVRALASVVFVLTYWLVGRYVGTSMRDSVGPDGHAWLHGPNQTNLSKAVSAVWGLLSAVATLYILTPIIFGPDFVDNSLVFRWIGGVIARSPAANDLLEGLELVSLGTFILLLLALVLLLALLSTPVYLLVIVLLCAPSANRYFRQRRRR